jgi:cell division septum initiation protein DivIVA
MQGYVEQVSAEALDRQAELKHWLTNIEQSSGSSMDEMKKMVHELEENSKSTSFELRSFAHEMTKRSDWKADEMKDLIDSIKRDRAAYVNELKHDRQMHRQDIEERERLFHDFVHNFRQTAAAEEEEEKVKSWWRFWK